MILLTEDLQCAKGCTGCRYDVKLEAVLRARRRAGRMMPLINVIPPGLDFSSLKVDLPKDPAQGGRPPPKHASFSNLHSNPTSPRSFDGSSPHAEPARLSDVGSPGDFPLCPILLPLGQCAAGSCSPAIVASVQCCASEYGYKTANPIRAYRPLRKLECLGMAIEVPRLQEVAVELACRGAAALVVTPDAM